MTFSLYALLGDEAPKITNESLEMELKNFFRREENFSIDFDKLPFAKNKSLILRWGIWIVRVFYEEGNNVVQDSVEINKIVGAMAPYNLSKIDRRIRVVFSNDDEKEFTNQIIYLIEFLQEIPGAIIFDPQQNDLVK